MWGGSEQVRGGGELFGELGLEKLSRAEMGHGQQAQAFTHGDEDEEQCLLLTGMLGLPCRTWALGSSSSLWSAVVTGCRAD